MKIIEILNGHTNVTNKEIFYSDDALVITSIPSIKEEDIETCIKTILEENSTITFNTIQYSKNKQLLYFYTTEKISIEKWNELKNESRTDKELVTILDCAEEIEHILAQNFDKEMACEKFNEDPNNIISLYDVAEVITESYEKMDRKLHDYKVAITNKLSQAWDSGINLGIVTLIPIGRYAKIEYGADDAAFIRIIGYQDYFDYVLLKNGDDFSIKSLNKSNSSSRSQTLKELDKALEHVRREIIELFNMLKKIENQFDRRKETIIKPINSNCNVLITLEIDTSIGLRMSTREIEFYNQNKIISVKKDCYHNVNVYKNSTNSFLVNSSLAGNEETLYKNILVRISDCPEWIQESLYERRKEQIDTFNQQKRLQQTKQQQLEQQSEQPKQDRSEKKLKRRKGFLPHFKKQRNK